MRPLRMVPGPVHLSPPQFPSRVSVLPSRPRLRTFCRVAITRQSPLPFGTLMDARCVGTGVPVGSMGCDRIHTRGSVGFFHAEKTRVQLCKSSGCQAQGRVSFCVPTCVRACARARAYIYCREFTEPKRAVSFILCFSPEVLSSNLTLLLCPTIFRENKRVVPDYVLRKSAEMTFNKTQIY